MRHDPLLWLDAALGLAAGAGWSRAWFWKHRTRTVERQLTRYERTADEIDEGPDSTRRPVALTLPPNETVIKRVGRYRNPARRP